MSRNELLSYPEGVFMDSDPGWRLEIWTSGKRTSRRRKRGEDATRVRSSPATSRSSTRRLRRSKLRGDRPERAGLPAQLHGRKARSVAYAEKQPDFRYLSATRRAATVVTKVATDPDIAALAMDLDHIPARLLTFVHDTIDLDRRWGAYRSPLQNLREGRGTVWDQAWLLQALLAAGGMDARFVWAEIETSPAALTAPLCQCK